VQVKGTPGYTKGSTGSEWQAFPASIERAAHCCSERREDSPANAERAERAEKAESAERAAHCCRWQVTLLVPGRKGSKWQARPESAAPLLFS